MTDIHTQPEQASSRQIIDVAVGVLIGCAAALSAKHSTSSSKLSTRRGVGLGATAQALVALASGTCRKRSGAGVTCSATPPGMRWGA
jgi:hypothetical protein